MTTPSNSRHHSTIDYSSKALAITPNPLYRFLYRTPAKVLIPPKRTLVTIQDDMSVFDAMAILHSHKILAAPVLAQDGTCMGSIDVLSILAYPGASHWETPSQLWTNIKDLKVREIAENVIERKKLVPFFSENPVSMLIDLFGTGIHRVALFHGNKELIATLSQSDVVRYIADIIKHNNKLLMSSPLSSSLTSSPKTGSPPLPTPSDVNPEALRNIFNTPASELGLFQIVKTLPATTTMLSAMKELASCLRQGLAIVDAQGRLVGDISVSDLHDLPEVNFSSLNMSVIHWLQAFSTSALTPPTTSFDSTFADIVLQFAREKHHRMWIVNEAGEPTHVVSLTDILAALRSGDVVDSRMASGDTNIHLLWRVASPPYNIPM